MVDLLELVDDPVFAIQAAIRGELKNVWTVLPVVVQSSKEGHVAVLQSAINGQVRKDDDTIVTAPLPQFSEVPIHFAGGGGVSATHPVKSGDEGIAVFMARPQDTWHQSGGTNNDPIDSRYHSLSDARYIAGGRSDPRKLKNVAPDAHHVRSDDGKHTVEVHPTKGITHKSVPPSDASPDPFNAATTYSSTEIKHDTGVTHKRVKPGQSHSVTIGDAGVAIASSVGIALSAPPGTITGLPAPAPADLTVAVGPLQNFANDAAAAAGGILVNHLYRNGSVVQIRVV